jgi:hypothetical protein
MQQNNAHTALLLRDYASTPQQAAEKRQTNEQT